MHRENKFVILFFWSTILKKKKRKKQFIINVKEYTPNAYHIAIYYKKIKCCIHIRKHFIYNIQCRKKIRGKKKYIYLLYFM